MQDSVVPALSIVDEDDHEAIEKIRAFEAAGTEKMMALWASMARETKEASVSSLFVFVPYADRVLPSLYEAAVKVGAPIRQSDGLLSLRKARATKGGFDALLKTAYLTGMADGASHLAAHFVELASGGQFRYAANEAPVNVFWSANCQKALPRIPNIARVPGNKAPPHWPREVKDKDALLEFACGVNVAPTPCATPAPRSTSAVPGARHPLFGAK